MTLHPDSKTTIPWDKPNHARQKLKTLTEHKHETLTDIEDNEDFTKDVIHSALFHSQKDFVLVHKPVAHESLVIEK